MTEDPARPAHPFAPRLEGCRELIDEFAAGHEDRVEPTGRALECLGEPHRLLHADGDQRLRRATKRLIEAEKRIAGVTTANQGSHRGVD